MQEMYKRAAEFWAELRVELLSASAFLTDEKPNSSQVWRVYWASHQVHCLRDLWLHLLLHFLFSIFFFPLSNFLSLILSYLFIYYLSFGVCMYNCSVSLDTCVCQLRCLLL